MTRGAVPGETILEAFMKTWQWITLGAGVLGLSYLIMSDKKTVLIRREPRPEDLEPPPPPKAVGEILFRVPGGIPFFPPFRRSQATVGIPEMKATLSTQVKELEERYQGLSTLADMRQLRLELFGPDTLPSGRLPMPRPEASSYLPHSFASNVPTHIRDAVGSFLSLFPHSPSGPEGAGPASKRELSVTVDVDHFGVPRSSFLRNRYSVDVSTKSNTKQHVELTWHEMSHALEYGAPALGIAANTFIRMRTLGEPITSMDELYAGAGYAASEIVSPDDFFTEYVGRLYSAKPIPLADSPEVPEVAMTEVLSMALQFFADSDDSMLYLWRKDREHFAFACAAIRGLFGYV